VNRSKARGDRWERECARLVIAYGFTDGARMLRTGAHVDHGDIIGVPGWLIDCKDAQRHEHSVWLDEATFEALAIGRRGATWVKRPRRPPEDAFAITTVGDWLDMQRQLADALARIAALEGESP
jgi:hypothetical protein